MRLAELIRAVRRKLANLDITEVDKEAWDELMKLDDFMTGWGFMPNQPNLEQFRSKTKVSEHGGKGDG